MLASCLGHTKKTVASCAPDTHSGMTTLACRPMCPAMAAHLAEDFDRFIVHPPQNQESACISEFRIAPNFTNQATLYQPSNAAI